MKSTLLLSIICLLINNCILGQTSQGSNMKYLGEQPPGLTPKVFAPDQVSLEHEYEYGSVFSANGDEFFYGVDTGGKAEIRYMKLQHNKWSAPVKLIFSEENSFNDPFLSPDETRLYFISDLTMNGSNEQKDYDIWYVERKENGWSQPINAGEAINSSKNEYYMSFTNEGTMYFSSNAKADPHQGNNFDIYASKNNSGEFQIPQKLDGSVNTPNYEADVFVAYDESYLIFSSVRSDGYGNGDLYISFKNGDNTWTQAKTMGDIINTSGHELCPFVSKDEKYFFYTSDKDIYWVDASIIDALR